MKFISIKVITKYTIFVILLIYTMCQKVPWNHSECLNYLNSLDIICNKIIKIDNGKELCEEYEFPLKIDLPIECNNKKYKLNAKIKGSNPPIKKSLDILINFENFYFDLKEYTKNHSYFIKSMEKCIKNSIIYNKNCLSAKDIENEKECKKLEKIKNSPFCNALDDVFKYLEVQLNSKLKGDDPKYFKDFKFNYFINEILYLFGESNDNNIIQNIINEKIDKKINSLNFQETEDEKSYFNKGNNKNKEYENELEEYYNNSRRDCVEYGLKSLEENIIICTKYE